MYIILVLITHVPLQHINYAGIGPQLQKLDLAISNAFCEVIALLPTTIADLFPNLLELVFAHQYMPNFSRKEFCQGLPASLAVLYLPCNIGFDLESILSMPCHLTELDLCLYPTYEGDEVRFREATIFTRLTSLSFDILADVDWGKMLPPSVTKFSRGDPLYSMTHNVVQHELFGYANYAVYDDPPEPTRPILTSTISNL